MVSRRNFVIIVIVMAITLFLFQFSQVARNAGNDYTNNPYADTPTIENHEWKGMNVDVASADSSMLSGKTYTLFLGDKESNYGNIVNQWAKYTKRNLVTTKNLSDFKFSKENKPEFVIVDSKYAKFDTDTAKFKEFVDNEVSIVFGTLPESSVVMANDELKSLLGVSGVKEEEVTVEGIKLFAGFLLGGETIYEPQKKNEEKRQDLALTMPWYLTAGGTKTYMVGLMDEYYKDYEFKNDYFPAIIWRNSFGNAQVFCVCGDYMNTTTGLGILSAMIYELSDYQLYPVVNAQNTLLVDYPLMANENEDKVYSIYTRSYDAFQSGPIWSSLISLAEKDKLAYTSFLSPKYNYNDPAEPSHDNYSYFLKMFNERDIEVGLSLEHDANTDLMDKLDFDKQYYDALENRYPATSAFFDMKDIDYLSKAVNTDYVKRVRTIACDENINVPILSYITPDITLQSLTSNTEDFTYSRDLMLKSIETVLGYDNAKLTFSKVAWPQDESDQWENIYDDMSSSLATFWQPFRVFDHTTLTESDSRVRTFLNIDYSSDKSNEVIQLNVTGRDDNTCYFILRTHGEDIKSATGATYEKIEDYAYLIKVDNDYAVINVENTLEIR